MAWITPKVNWDTVPINPTSTDLNRIEGNLDFLKLDIETKKGLIVDGLNTMGVSASIGDTYAQLKAKMDVATSSMGDAVVGDVLATKKFTKSGSFGLTGTMPNRGAVTLNPSTTNQTITAGYHNGSGIVNGDADLIGANIKPTKNIFGVASTMPTKSAQTFTPSTATQTIAVDQYLTGIQTILGDADLVDSNIKIGKNLFGVVGNVQELEYKAGNTYTASSIAEISSTIAGNTEVNFGRVTIYPKGTIRIKGVFTADSPGMELERYEIKLLKNGVQFGGTILTTQPVDEYDRSITSWSFDVPITATTTLQLRVKNRSVYNRTPKTSIQSAFDYFITIASAITAY